MDVTFYYLRMNIYNDDDRYLIDLEGHWALMILFFMELGNNNNNNMYILLIHSSMSKCWFIEIMYVGIFHCFYDTYYEPTKHLPHWSLKPLF